MTVFMSAWLTVSKVGLPPWISKHCPQHLPWLLRFIFYPYLISKTQCILCSPWCFLAFNCTHTLSSTHRDRAASAQPCVCFDQLIKGHRRRNLLIEKREVCSLWGGETWEGVSILSPESCQALWQHYEQKWCRGKEERGGGWGQTQHPCC